MMKAKPVQALDKKQSEKPIRKPTHLYLQEKLLKEIPAGANCDTLTALYLHNNNIEKIANLTRVRNLKNLYLQCNQIKKIEGLEELKNLKCLYLGNNEISVLENLQNIDLEVLHIEKQRLKCGEMLCFDPRTIHSLTASLQVLNICNNNITSFTPLTPLLQIRVLQASNNKVQEVEDITNTIRYWYYLYEASFVGNPVTKKHRYRETIIGRTIRLEMLDNKPIAETTRNFIKRFEAELSNKPMKSINLAEIHPELPHNFSHPLQKAVSASIIKTCLSKQEMEEIDYIPWKAMPKKRRGTPKSTKRE